MSQENVELVRRGMESAQAFWALFDERIVFNMRLVPDSDGEYVGREAAIQAGRQYWGTFEDYHLDALELIEAGSSIVSSCAKGSRKRQRRSIRKAMGAGLDLPERTDSPMGSLSG
jgi:hypothetical protein